MNLTILGCYAATPRSLSNPTAQVLQIKKHHILIDCGEGTQVQLRKQKIKFGRIEKIFISHLHGDHFYGLPGLITTFNLLGREKPLHIYAPRGAKESINMLLSISDSKTRYELIFHELYTTKSECIFEDDTIEVHTIPLTHRVYANGYLFKEKTTLRKLNIDAVTKYGIDRSEYQNVKDGKDIIVDTGEKIANTLVSFDPAPPKSYAFCSDTVYREDICPLISGVDALYHESTFLQSEETLAQKTKHSTAIQAAKIAKQAQVKRLILGHYSTRYSDIEIFAKEAATVFEQVELADDGKVFDI